MEKREYKMTKTYKLTEYLHQLLTCPEASKNKGAVITAGPFKFADVKYFVFIKNKISITAESITQH